MSSTSSESSRPTLGYAALASHEPLPLARIALMWARIGAAIALVAGVLPLALGWRYLGQLDLILRDAWSIAAFVLFAVTAILLILCTTLFLRSAFLPSRARTLRRLFALTWILSVATLAFQISRAFATPRRTTAFQLFEWDVSYYANQLGRSLYLLIPSLLMLVVHRTIWWRRAAGLAAGAAFFLGVDGVATLIEMLQPSSGPFSLSSTWVERLQALAREPVPLVGFWPLAPFLAGILFIRAALNPDRRKTALAGVILVAIFVGLVHRPSYVFVTTSVFGIDTWLASATDLVVSMVNRSIPILLLAHALWHERHLRPIAEPVDSPQQSAGVSD